MAFDPLSSDFIESSLHHQKESLDLIENLKRSKTKSTTRQPSIPKVKFFISKELKQRLQTLRSRQLSENIVTKICDDLLSIKTVPHNSINYLGLSNDNFSKISYLNPDRKERVSGKTFVDKYITPLTTLVVIYEQEVTLMDKEVISQNNYEYLTHINKGQDWRKFPKSYFKNDKKIKMDRKKRIIGEDENNMPIYEDYYTIPNLKDLENLGEYVFNEEGCLKTQYSNKTISKWFLYNLKSVTLDSVWDHNMRHHQSIHKILNNLFGEKYTEREKNFFSEQYFKLVIINRPDITLKIVEGDWVVQYYNENCYYKPINNSSLWNSCMRYAHCGSYLNFYNEVPGVRLSVLLYKDRLVARSLLWTSNDKIYYDRIYSYNAEYEALLENLLICSDFKKIRVYNSPGSEMIEEVNVPLPMDMFYNVQSYPYLDSLRYYSPNQGLLTNKNLSKSDILILDRTDGSYSGTEQMEECSLCGRETDEDNLNVIDLGPHEDECACDRCATYSEVYLAYISRDHSVFCSFTQSYILESDAVEVPTGICFVSYDNLREYQNDFGWFVLDEHEYIEIEGEYYHVDDPNIPYPSEKVEENDVTTVESDQNLNITL
jgi:hypothetical protein